MLKEHSIKKSWQFRDYWHNYAAQELWSSCIHWNFTLNWGALWVRLCWNKSHFRCWLIMVRDPRSQVRDPTQHHQKKLTQKIFLLLRLLTYSCKGFSIVKYEISWEALTLYIYFRIRGRSTGISLSRHHVWITAFRGSHGSIFVWYGSYQCSHQEAINEPYWYTCMLSQILHWSPLASRTLEELCYIEAWTE